MYKSTLRTENYVFTKYTELKASRKKQTHAEWKNWRRANLSNF